MRSLFHDLLQNKQHYLQPLESRLQELDDSESLSVTVAHAYATLKALLHSTDELSILRHALGDIQTGVVNIFNLQKHSTEQASAAIFTEIESNLANSEQQLAQTLSGSNRNRNP